MHAALPSKTIALVGVGHTNAHIVRMWRMHPLPDTRLVCISNFRKATYSGMLPGVLAGSYSPEEMTIDLVRLCQTAGAELIIDEVVGLNEQNNALLFRERPPIRFDALSIGVGSVPSFEGVEVHGDRERLLMIKPMQTFLKRLDKAVASHTREHTSLDIAIVGGGAGGTEVAFCLPQRLRTQYPQCQINVHLVYGTLLPGFCERTRERVKRRLEEAGVSHYPSQRAKRIESGQITTTDGSQISVDLTIWATRAMAPTLLNKFDLPKDERGFLETDATLKSTANAQVFAVGDTGTIRSESIAKAGVYAVRQGPVLWNNLQRSINGLALEEYKPQRSFLKLLNTGDGKAIGEYHGRSFDGTWAFRWKDHIDRKFMHMYQDYASPMMSVATSTDSPSDALATKMRCLGCGGKVGGSLLSRALANLDIQASPEVLVGLNAPDDAAILKLAGDHPITVTTDFFASPISDHYLAGRIAALNALSDVWTMGARPVAALAIAILPFGPERAQEQVLTELMAGSVQELDAAGATLVGGHTIEGPRTSFGFTIVADQHRHPTTKADARADQLLVLTKPLGSGVLLAAHMQSKCTAGSMKALERTLLQSNQPAAESALSAGASALTDVTGFGLAGHLLEMLTASQLSAELELASIPLIFGVDELLSEGIESTLAPANRHVEVAIDVAPAHHASSPYLALFDPQTNGGILYSIDASRFVPVAGHHVIGRTTLPGEDGPRIRPI